MEKLVEDISVKGILKIRIYKNNVLIEENCEENHIVNESQVQISHLLGGDVAGRSITKIAFGTNGALPTDTDASIENAFVKNISVVVYPELGSVQFNWNLGITENNGMSILEFGLLTEDGTLFSRRIRNNPLNKEPDISIEGSWTINFTKEN